MFYRCLSQRVFRRQPERDWITSHVNTFPIHRNQALLFGSSRQESSAQELLSRWTVDHSIRLYTVHYPPLLPRVLQGAPKILLVDVGLLQRNRFGCDWLCLVSWRCLVDERGNEIRWLVWAHQAHGNYQLGNCKYQDNLSIIITEKNFSTNRALHHLFQYGYVIGQINETPLLPKFVPVFIILSSSTLVEIILVWLWDDDVFVIKSAPELESGGSKTATLERNPLSGLKSPGMGSLAGSLRLDRRTGQALRDLVATDDLNSRLKHLAESARSPGNTLRHRGQVLDLSAIGDDLEATSTVQQDEQNRNIQAILLTMIFKNDGRLIKYLLLFTMFGIAVSPFQFLFLTLEEISKERAVNFSNLAGTVIVSQAAIEAVAFFIMPWLNRCASRTSILTTGLLVLAARCFFYGYFYYTQDISLYWAVLAEWGHGIPFAMFCTLQADIAVMFAGQSAIFVPQLIKLGILSDPELVGRLKAKEEEESIKTMLRATMNAIFSGANEGFGQGLGCLICGLVYDHFGYVNLWRVVFFVTAATMIAHLATEATRSQYSDYCSKYRKTSIKAELTNQCSGENIEQNVISHHLKKPDEEEKPRS